MWRFFHQWGSPKPFYELSGRFLPWVGTLSVLVLAAGLGWGLLFAPADYQQGHSVRIMYIHVPAAIVAQSSYVLMALCALVSLIWRMKLADVAFTTLAPIGAIITALALVTGAIWGKPTWGTYWVWDARLTTTLLLFLIFLGYFLLRLSVQDREKEARFASVLGIIGFLDIPIVHKSVEWWRTLHQPSTLFKVQEGAAKPAMPPELLYPLLACMFAMLLFYGYLLLLRWQMEENQDQLHEALAQEVS